MIGPEAFMDHAKKIIMQENNPQEAEFRSAVSRAYYSVFHEAHKKIFAKYKTRISDVICKQLESRDGEYDKSKVESLDLKYLAKKGINMHRIIPIVLTNIDENMMSLEFKSCRDDRNRADYDIHMPHPNESTQDTVEEMERLVLKIRRI